MNDDLRQRLALIRNYELVVIRHLVRARGHDLNNTVTRLGGELSLAATDLVDDVERKERLGSASSLTGAITNTIGDLTEIARMQNDAPFPVSRLRDDLRSIFEVAHRHDAALEIVDDPRWYEYAGSGLHAALITLTGALLDEPTAGETPGLSIEDGPTLVVARGPGAAHMAARALAAAHDQDATVDGGSFRLRLPSLG